MFSQVHAENLRVLQEFLNKFLRVSFYMFASFRFVFHNLKTNVFLQSKAHFFIYVPRQ